MVHLQKTPTNDAQACATTLHVTHMAATRNLEVFAAMMANQADRKGLCKKCQKIYNNRAAKQTPQKAIAFKAAAGMGIEETTWYYWDGNKFTTQYITTFGDELADELVRATVELGKNHAAVALWPEDYQFGIKTV